MKQSIHSQKGFGAVEALIIILILAVIGFGGYYVWNSNKDDAQSTKTAATTDSTPSNENSSSTKYFTIAEFGVRLPLTSELSGLKAGAAVESSFDTKNMSVNVLAPELDADYTCAADSDGTKASLGGIMINTSGNPGSGQYTPAATKKIGDTYYFYFESYGCFDGTAKTKFDGLKADFAKQFDNLQAY
ncbi:MAG: hypothetical protein JWM81_1150 [Candidatus Saccharibacteria bacterium]|nr:hypothetical protein [Candidatus Saccharibacteria bacterium]